MWHAASRWGACCSPSRWLMLPCLRPFLCQSYPVTTSGYSCCMAWHGVSSRLQVSLITGPYSCLLPPLLYSLFGTCVQARMLAICVSEPIRLKCSSPWKASVGTGGLVPQLARGCHTRRLLQAWPDSDEASAKVALLTGEQLGQVSGHGKLW